MRRRVVSFLVLLSVAVSIGLLTVSRFRMADARDDIRAYIGIQQGTPLSEIAPPYRYRVVTPLLARAVPAPPVGLFVKTERIDDTVIVFQFALINAIGLAVAAWFLMRSMDAMKFEPWQSFSGSLLFLGSFASLGYGALPRVDAWAYAFLSGCLWALVGRRPALLFVLFSLGLFTKETILLVPLAVLLLKQDRKQRVVQLACLVPGLVSYIVFRVLLFPAEQPLYSVTSAGKFVAEVFGSERFGFYTSRGALTFGILWLLAAWGWAQNRRRTDHPLIRWSWIVPIVLVIPFVLALHVHQLLAFSFPVVIPLAVWGMVDLWGEGK